MRIADELQAHGKLLDMPRWYIDNVAQYVGRIKGNIDVPTLAPPFRRFWIEYSVPQDGSWMKDIGAEFSVYDDPLWVCRQDNELIKCGGAPPGSKSRWILIVQAWIRARLPTELLAYPMMFAYHVGSDGEIIGRCGAVDDRDGQPLVSGDVWDRQFSDSTVNELDWVLWPCAVAISFGHCKNVRHVEHIPGGKLEKARLKRGRKPTLRYYTLEIDPMREVLRREGHSDTLGLKQAMHICRGHFKDYRQSGLFGKIKGVFWWDQAVRGTAEAGVVVKDYSVKAPT